eukprot:TRINITY_DN76528_c0_g1_i1.p1 TRINITY_DN76528_c0_g1~~TRINITY_DN76528_c0_g1_i1.p1  ORF type:complete len:1173 (+),score=188.80 TRINITY_DN76528_c0_g1_i1:49-3519(+)
MFLELLVVLLTLAANVALAGLADAERKASRPCTDEDWLFDFSECQEVTNAGHVRQAFAYADPAVCDPGAEGSSKLPKPLNNLPCEEPCEAGSRYAISSFRQGGKARSEERAQLRVQCETCPPGKFSLGGGSLIDGTAGDWAKPWLAGLSTACLYRTTDYSWRLGGGDQLKCVLHLDQGAAKTVETRAGAWNAELPDVEVKAPLVMVKDLACEAYNSTMAEAISGAVVLVSRGVCTFQNKTMNLAAAGAVAVVLFNNIAHRAHFIPAAPAGSEAPNIPIFMVTKEDGERWARSVRGASVPPQFRTASSHCRLDRQEAVHVNLSALNVSLNGSEDSWEKAVKGCSHWTADPAGGFLHSGRNKLFHWLYSFLTLSVRFVRDGHIRFRYAVDAEMTYDGLDFEIDGVPAWNATVSVQPLKVFRVNVSRGPHSFTWTYKKDFGTSHGEDRARLQLLEISGTSHADYTCRSCSAVSALEGSHCGVCPRNKYGLVLDEGMAIRCRNCPSGRWSPPASIGESSCQARRPCTRSDITISYFLPTAADPFGLARRIAGDICRDNKTRVHVSWRLPITCDTQAADRFALASMSTDAEERTCPPCQPLQWRPSGAACVNRPAKSCPRPTYAVPHLIVNQWHIWPRNVTSLIWGKDGRQEHSWQLASDGSSVVVGSAFIGGGGAEIESLLTSRGDQALLKLDVNLTSAGLLEVFIEERPPGAWKTAGALYIDHEPLQPDTEDVVGSLRRMTLGVAEGWHWVTLVWRYQGPEVDEVSADFSPFEGGSGLRLLNFSLTNVAGASAAGVCQQCPPGKGVARPGGESRCEACPAGFSSRDYQWDFDGGPCSICPAGRAASGNQGRGSAICQVCGPGLRSGQGAAFCTPHEVLGVATGNFPQWQTQAIADAWLGQAGAEAVNGLRIVQVEERWYYINFFQPSQLAGSRNAPAGVTAYWWEWLPSRTETSSDTCASQQGAFVRPVGDLLEAVKVDEGAGTSSRGAWLTFSGDCKSASGSRVRRADLFLSCDPNQHPDHLQLNFLHNARPSSGCEDVALEWRTPAACPLCRASDWQPVTDSICDPAKGQHITYLAPEGCFGGEPAPKDFWQPCPGVVNMAALLVILAVIGCSLCCLSCYVMLLRRRYSKYIMLGDGPAVSGNGVAPSTMGSADASP